MADPNDFGSGLNVKGGLRYLYKRFSFGGESNEAYDQGIERIFGKKAKKYCEECGKLPSWCECVQALHVQADDTDPG